MNCFVPTSTVQLNVAVATATNVVNANYPNLCKFNSRHSTTTFSPLCSVSFQLMKAYKGAEHLILIDCTPVFLPAL